jgi:hypothetical protein
VPEGTELDVSKVVSCHEDGNPAWTTGAAGLFTLRVHARRPRRARAGPAHPVGVALENVRSARSQQSCHEPPFRMEAALPGDGAEGRAGLTRKRAAA